MIQLTDPGKEERMRLRDDDLKSVIINLVQMFKYEN